MDLSPNKDESEQLTQQIEDLSINNDKSTLCANCCKVVVGNPNICNKCKAETYCNAACKKRHRHKHKDSCEQHIAELQEEDIERKKRAAELQDKELFKQPPQEDEECPICCLPTPPLATGTRYGVCCGQKICGGCVYAFLQRTGKKSCPFCRSPLGLGSDDLAEKRKKRIDAGDPRGLINEADCFANGTFGYPLDKGKAFELNLRASELGSSTAHESVAAAYLTGDGVERNNKKGMHYTKLAALGGSPSARRTLGDSERMKGNVERATKHYMISAAIGDTFSVYEIEDFFMEGHVTKENYEKALQAHQVYIDSIRSDQRDEAAVALGHHCRYYEPLQPLTDDDELFEQPPPNADCPVCRIPLPLFSEKNSLARRYQSCCGQFICGGCMWEVESPRMATGAPVPCPSCKTLVSEDQKSVVQGLMKRADVNDVNAMTLLGSRYAQGSVVPQNVHKAIELWEQAAEFGGIWALHTLGKIFEPESTNDFDDTDIVKDRKKSFRYYAEAAKGGHDLSRYNLGVVENNHGRKRLAMKHFLIATSSGNADALTQVKRGHTDGRVTKEEFDHALRAHKESQDLMNSVQRMKPKEMERRMMEMMKVMSGGRGPGTYEEVLSEARKMGINH